MYSLGMTHTTEQTLHPPNRYRELSRDAQHRVDLYVNSVASGDVPGQVRDDAVSGIRMWLARSETHRRRSSPYKHAIAMIQHHLAFLGSTEDL
jgi:hypothetical protein